jgi:hypothetical protein
MKKTKELPKKDVSMEVEIPEDRTPFFTINNFVERLKEEYGSFHVNQGGIIPAINHLTISLGSTFLVFLISWMVILLQVFKGHLSVTLISKILIAFLLVSVPFMLTMYTYRILKHFWIKPKMQKIVKHITIAKLRMTTSGVLYFNKPWDLLSECLKALQVRATELTNSEMVSQDEKDSLRKAILVFRNIPWIGWYGEPIDKFSEKISDYVPRN